jgi:fatty-acyl-CoA synthase
MLALPSQPCISPCATLLHQTPRAAIALGRVVRLRLELADRNSNNSVSRVSGETPWIAETRSANLDAVAPLHQSPAQAWARALRNIAPLQHQPGVTLPTLVDVWAEQYDAQPALESGDETLTYRSLGQRKNQYARWALAQNVQAGEVVCLLMENCPAYMALWLGITQIGAVVALINTTLRHDALLHAIGVAAPAHIIADPAMAGALQAIRPRLAASPMCWLHGKSPRVPHGMQQLDAADLSGTELCSRDYTAVSTDQTALLIYTSGTTGLPKAARISHYRVLEWSLWFAGMMDTQETDRLYNCLPLYHSTGGIAGPGGVLANGGTVVIRRRFSARRFWADIAQARCTIFLYIGELCRYLAEAPPQAMEMRHQLRLCCGNGLRAEVWTRFMHRFDVPQILEFYASTEGNVSLYNCEGQPGAIGRVPSFLAHRFPIALIACDPQTGAAQRGADGHCIRCAPDEAGEAIGKIIGDSGPNSFEGYTDRAATETKILRDVFTPGDAWFRTGDLMRQDRAGFFYFVDRMGDTFRWKGENVSTAQVAEIIGAYPGIANAVVYGVEIPNADGRAGMAAITLTEGFDPAGLHAWLAERLPAYARPVFLRLCERLETTGTFKPVKARLVQEGYDVAIVTDPVYVVDEEAGTYRPLRVLQPA